MSHATHVLMTLQEILKRALERMKPNENGEILAVYMLEEIEIELDRNHLGFMKKVAHGPLGSKD